MERVTKHTSTTKITPKPTTISAGNLDIKAGRFIADGAQITANGTANIHARDEIKFTGMYSCDPIIDF